MFSKTCQLKWHRNIRSNEKFEEGITIDRGFLNHKEYYVNASTFEYLGKRDTFLKKHITKLDARRNIKY